MSEEQMGEEKMTAIIGFRVWPWWKEDMQEEAEARGITLSAYILELIMAGEKKMAEDVKQQGSEKP